MQMLKISVLGLDQMKLRASPSFFILHSSLFILRSAFVRNMAATSEKDSNSSSAAANLAVAAILELEDQRRSALEGLLTTLAQGGDNNGVLLSNVRVPLSIVKGEKDVHADEEGLVQLDVQLRNGKIAQMGAHGTIEADAEVSLGDAEDGNTVEVDVPNVLEAGGAILLPCFVDAHTHIVKTQTTTRCRNPTGSINDALACEVDDRPRWNVHDDARRRMDFAMRCAYHYGTAAMRTHLDGTDAASCPAELVSAVYSHYDELREKWMPKGLELQGVANSYLFCYLDADFAKKHAAEAARHGGVALGAYCGNIAGRAVEETKAAFDAMLRLASEHSLDVDIHIDETNDKECCALIPFCDSLSDARGAGYTGTVVLGHACSLALQSTDVVAKVASKLAQLQPCFVVANPVTNLGLQDRRGTAPPIGSLVESDVDHTPRWRGVAPMQELLAAGVPVAAASDNVRDWWGAFGTDYDGLAVYASALAIGHLDTVPNEGAWAGLVTSTAAAAMRAKHTAVLKVGANANLVFFPNARRMSELLCRPGGGGRVVLREGVPSCAPLPSFDELDDLVNERTERTTPGGTVQRGAAPMK
ncbi:cytosine deaminase [Pseudoscourfieldia marina]